MQKWKKEIITKGQTKMSATAAEIKMSSTINRDVSEFAKYTFQFVEEA